MPVTSNSWTYGCYKCVDPLSLLEGANRSKISQAFIGKANSYRCPQGRAWGEGFVLMYGRDVAAMFAESKKAPRALTISLQRNGEAETKNNVATTLTIKSLFCLRAINITPMLGPGNLQPWQDRKVTQPNYAVRFWNNARPINNDAVYMLELVDRRYFLARFTVINKCYNVPVPLRVNQGLALATDGYSYYEDSLNAGQLWTSKETLNDIWTIMGSNLTGGSLTYAASSSTNFPNVTSGTHKPYNFRFDAVNAWEAFHDALESICMGSNSLLWKLVYNPVTDAFAVTTTSQPALQEPELQSDDTLKYLEAIRIYDSEVIETGIGITAKKQRVYYKRKYDSGTNPPIDSKTGLAWSYPVNVMGADADTTITTPVTNQGGMDAVDDTIDFLIEGTPHGIYLQTPDTSDEVAVNETTVTYDEDRIGNRLQLNQKYGFILFRGIATTELNAIILPKIQIRQAVWRDYGDEFGLVTEFHNYEGDFPPPTSRDTQSFSSREHGNGPGLYFPSGYGNLLNNYSAGTPNSRHFAPDFNRFDWRDEVPETAIVRSVIAYPVDYASTGTADDQTKSTVGVGLSTTGAVGVIIQPGRQFSPDPEYHGPKCYIRAKRGWSFAKPNPVNSDILASSIYGIAEFIPPNREFVGRLIGVASDNIPIYEVTVFAEIFELELDDTLGHSTVAKAILSLDSGTGGASDSFVYVSGAYLPRFPTTMSTELSGGDAHSHTIDSPYPLAAGVTVMAFLNYQKRITVGFNTAYLHAFAWIP